MQTSLEVLAQKLHRVILLPIGQKKSQELFKFTREQRNRLHLWCESVVQSSTCAGMKACAGFVFPFKSFVFCMIFSVWTGLLRQQWSIIYTGR